MDNETEPVGPELLLTALERGSGAPLHEQLESRLRDLVRSGRLPAGTRLPSSRALAAALGVSRGIALEAYGQLSAEGYLTASQGAATRVAATAGAERPPVPARSLEPRFEHDLRPGVPDLVGFPRAAWLRSLRAILSSARFDEFGAADPRGTPELRNHLMSYLGRARGAAPEPEHTLICSGFAQGFATLCRTLRDRGIERIAIEDPAYAGHRLIAERAGLEPVPIRVDERGIDVAELSGSDCEVVVVTPAHQFPSGVVLAPDRRVELLAWAEEQDRLIVEDDYDSELRYGRVAVGALQGLAPERICQIGSVSKRLAPGLALGWVLSPSWLTGALSYEKALTDGGTSALEQLALADFIARGELDRHVRRMRLRYRRRRDALLAALASEIRGARVGGIAAGLFVPVALPEGIDEDALLSAAQARGLGTEGLATFLSVPPDHGGLVLGFGNVSEHAIPAAVRLLGDAVHSIS